MYIYQNIIFELHSRYYDHFRTKTLGEMYEPLYPPQQRVK